MKPSTLLRAALLGSSALVPLAALVGPVAPAHAACVITGSGTLFGLDTNDRVDCTGTTATFVRANGVTGVQAFIGDGSTTTTLNGDPFATIHFTDTTFSTIEILNNATVIGGPDGIVIDGAGGSNDITVHAGGSITSTASGITFVSSNNKAWISGSVSTTGLAIPIILAAGSSSSQITIESGGLVQAGSSYAIAGLSSGNAIVNHGTIAGSNEFAIFFNSPNNTVVNSGVITSTGGAAIWFSAGDGLLELRAGSNITGLVDGDGTSQLGLGGAADATFDVAQLGTQYIGFNDLKKYGASTWTITGSSNYSGTTNVVGGTLVINGSLANSIVTLNGGTLGGTGTIGGLVVNTTSTLAPGNSIGTLNVAGNVTFNSGTTYQVEINGAGQSDQVAATGTATLNGGTVQIIPLGSAFVANTQYTILTAAGGLTGTFSSLAPLDAPLVAGMLTYDANNAYFLLQQVQGFGTLSGVTPNQSAVASALDAAQAGGSPSTPLTNAINALAAGSAGAILAGLDDLAGQVNADAHRFATMQGAGFHRVVTGAAGGWSGDVTRFSFAGPGVAGNFDAPMYVRGPSAPDRGAPASRERGGYAGWVGGWGNWDKVDRTSTTFGVNASAGGVAAGLELRGDHTTLGIAAGGSSGRLSTSGRRDSVDAEMAHAALYARQHWAGFEFDAAASLGYAWLETSRHIGFLGQTTRSDSSAVTSGLSFSAARPFTLGAFTAAPFASLDWYAARRDSFAETGAAGVDHLVASGTDDVLQGLAGLRLAYRVTPAGGLPWGVTARLAVRHDFDGGAPTMRTSFEGAPGVPLVIAGADYARTGFIAGAGLDAALGAMSSLRVGYEGDFSSDRVSHALRGGVQYRF